MFKAIDRTPVGATLSAGSRKLRMPELWRKMAGSGHGADPC